MVPMRQHGQGWAPVPRRRYAKLVVLLVTLVAIAAVSMSMRPVSGGKAVVRVSLDRIPEERVVEFGHEMPRMTMVVPVPVEEEYEPATAVVGQSVPARESKPQFAAAVQPREVPEPAAAKPVTPDANGILPIDFQLQEGVSSQMGGVGVAKTLAAEGGQATGLTIFLIGGSLIEVDRKELITALGQLGASEKAARIPPADETGRLSLDHVRTAGLDLRYDAILDRLVLRP